MEQLLTSLDPSKWGPNEKCPGRDNNLEAWLRGTPKVRQRRAVEATRFVLAFDAVSISRSARAAANRATACVQADAFRGRAFSWLSALSGDGGAGGIVPDGFGGEPGREDDEAPAHEVTFDAPFALG